MESRTAGKADAAAQLTHWYHIGYYKAYSLEIQLAMLQQPAATRRQCLKDTVMKLLVMSQEDTHKDKQQCVGSTAAATHPPQRQTEGQMEHAQAVPAGAAGEGGAAMEEAGAAGQPQPLPGRAAGAAGEVGAAVEEAELYGQLQLQLLCCG